ncbi:MAG: GNAT family N-acetyltransferase [Chloroflexi bacterium]|nr:GNAT family N-acetyltransferase [Chloroflexota bacterium]
MIIPTITTSRLVLRPFTPQDAIHLHRILNEDDILRYFPGTKRPSLEQTQRMVQGQLKHWQKYGCGWWAVESRANNQFIGWCGLQYLPDTDEIEVAYLLDKAHWGRGLATEAGLSSLQFGFETLGLTQIVGIVHPENKASQRVLEKSGLYFVEQTRYFGMDCYRYLITESGN